MLRRNQPVRPPLILHERASGEMRVYTQMPTPWLVHGFGAAVDRLSAALRTSSPTDERDISIAAFESASWLDAIHGREKIAGDVQIRALLYVRNRLHHQVAGAMGIDDEGAEWVWYPVENLPPVDDRYLDAAGERVYTKHLAGRPVLDAFAHARGVLETRWPVSE